DNPLQLVFARPNLDATVAQIANGRVLLANLFDGARAGLLSALHSIFLLGAGIMALSFALNLFLSDRSAAKRTLILQSNTLGSIGFNGGNSPA
ncbi:MAG TPA: hypothetical protein VNU44_24025, partial [Bryobacteraceae bacterium]|nr:hypothetical protein [Bryobacteraceae bacterium]